MTEWLKGCEVCNAALCTRFKELIEKGMSQRQAALLLEKEQKGVLGEAVYSSEALRRRFQRIVLPSGPIRTTQAAEPEEAPEPKGPIPPKEKDPYAHSDAHAFVTMAISQLERIMDDDPLRVEAVGRISKWIQEKLITWAEGE
jgi:hypothetical protein